MEIETIEKCLCGGKIIFEETPRMIHFGKLACEKCGSWKKWVKNPESESRTRQKTSEFDMNKILRFYEKKIPFCFFCLRTREMLGNKETLTLDHIEELSKGGSDQINNIQILCSACHKLKNWARLYINWHLKRDD